MTPIRFESGQARVDLKYAVTVALLLAVIITVLTQLWLIERNRRFAAEEELRKMYIQEQLRMAGEDLPATQPAASRKPPP